MSELLVKIQSLDEQAQQEVVDFVDFLLEKKGRRKPPHNSDDYRERLINISVWSEEDLKPIEEARRLFNNMAINEW